MTIEAGTKLGPYEVIGPLGAGGMGEVYQARDSRLDRTVAIKVLPSHLAENESFRQRFEREARAVSSLNHPHICTLHDVGEQDGVHYLVMEHLEGETLATRLEKGPLSLLDSLTYAMQIADALDKAHRQGVVHRDLKPGNIMLTKTGAKLLDFGLAKSAEAGAEATSMTAAPTAMSPLTTEGTIVGTFQYMSPEQLEGGQADTRSDIFAFGLVLYEMLSGRKAFEGKTQASLVASILKETPPPLATLQRLTPPALDRLVTTCIEKDPEERRQSMHDVLLELRWILKGDMEMGTPALTGSPSISRSWLAWGVAAVAVVVAMAALLFSGARTSRIGVGRFHASVVHPEGATFDYRHGPMALSPDGTKMVFVARDHEGSRKLWLRKFDQPAARVVEGTEDASFPFWSPDSRSIGFFADDKLKRIEVAGGPPDTLCDAYTGRGGAWNQDGFILFAIRGSSLQKVSASGGNPVKVTQLDKTTAEFTHRYPAFLPDGNHFLYSTRRGIGGENGVSVASLDGGESKRLLEINSNAVYVPSGHLLYWRDEALRAHPFNPDRLEFTGEPFPVAPGTRFEPDQGLAHFSASGNGILASYRGGSATTKSRLVLKDREGVELGQVGEGANYYSPRFSRDGKKIVVDNSGVQNNGDIWVYGVTRATATQLTLDPADESDPNWSPEGDRIAYVTETKGNSDVHMRSAFGGGSAEALMETDADEDPSDWSWDGKFLAVSKKEKRGSNVSDIWIYSFEEGKATPFLATPFHERQAQFSPDGRWIAYTSDESGRDEVYVRPRNGELGKWQISTGGGTVPRWRGDGKEMFYVDASEMLMAVPISSAGDQLIAEAPVPLFRAEMRFAGSDQYDASPDGQSFLINVEIADESAEPMSLLLNWTANLQEP